MITKTIFSNCRNKFPNILVKLLPSIDRAKSISSADDNLEVVIKMKREYPEIICGVDFSGSPFVGNFTEFKTILEKARGNELKLALHCGETENPLEINEMLEFGMDRLGHGTFIKGSYVPAIRIRIAIRMSL